MVKDSQRLSTTGGWDFQRFVKDSKTDLAVMPTPAGSVVTSSALGRDSQVSPGRQTARESTVIHNDDIVRREQLKRGLLDVCKQTVDARVNRYLEVSHLGIIPNHHFAPASSECVDLYRDGYFLSAVMVSQAVNEGIWKFVLERNGIPRDRSLSDIVPTLASLGIVSQECVDAFNRIWGSFRNDVHHMNPNVTEIQFDAIAKRNLADLAIIEREVFATQFQAGGLDPVQRKYWDLGADGMAQVFLRLDSVSAV